MKSFECKGCGTRLEIEASTGHDTVIGQLIENHLHCRGDKIFSHKPFSHAHEQEDENVRIMLEVLP